MSDASETAAEFRARVIDELTDFLAERFRRELDLNYRDYTAPPDWLTEDIDVG